MNNNVFIKTISFILICAILFCLSACGGSGNFEKEQEEKELITLTWTENSFAEKVPTPKSTLGYINNNNSSMFEVYLSDFTLDEFNEYVDACVEMGYTVEQNRQDAFFYAQTEDYYEVRVEHEDGNIIHIAISEVEYDVEIKVIRANNSSKCEVEIEIDGYYEEEIASGDMVASLDSYLNVGTHELRVINTEDDNIYGTIFFDVTSDSYYEFEINCTAVEVEISARGEANDQQGETETERPSDNKTEPNTNKEPESSPSTSPNETTEKESIDLAEARNIFEDVYEEYNTLIADFSELLDYCNENTFTSIEEIDEYENQWVELSNDAYQLASTLLVKIPPKEVEVEWSGFAERLMKIGSILFMNSTMDANLDGHYDAAEMETVINGACDEFIAVGEEIVDLAKRFNSITKGEAITIPDNTTSSNGKKCEECGKTATKTVNLFGQTEYYCTTHYNEIMDILDMMESDVGKGSASKHTCEECSNEGTHSIIGLSGKTEYYCTKHYNELKEMLEIFG